MSPQDKAKYWQVFDNFRKSREKKYAPKIARILTAQKREFIERHKRGEKTILLNSQPLYELIKELYLDAAIVFGHKVLVHIKGQREQKARMPIGFSARMQQLIELYYNLDFHDFGNSITETTRDILIKVLMDAQRAGLGFDDTIKLLEDTELSKTRARLIARTETVTAANSGAHLSAKESGIKVQKVWIATQDSRTRDDHYNVSSAAIEIDEPFNVGGYSMLHPGVRRQTNGLPVPAKEVCNCRCTEAFVPVRDASGRVLSA